LALPLPNLPLRATPPLPRLPPRRRHHQQQHTLVPRARPVKEAIIAAKVAAAQEPTLFEALSRGLDVFIITLESTIFKWLQGVANTVLHAINDPW
jgi:hypothetical protein